MRDKPVTDLSAPIPRRAFCGLIMAASALACRESRAAQGSSSLAIRAETLYPISGLPIKKGVVLVRDGKIVALGTDLAIPAGTHTLQVRTAMPGMVDPHTHLGCLNETEETTDAITPELRIRDAFDRSDPALKRAVRAGITSACIMPGNGNVLAGQGSVFHLGDDPQLLRDYAAQKISLTAFNAQRNPTSRAGALALARKAFDSAGKGQAVSSVTQTNLLADFPTALDERVHALAPILHGERPVFLHAPTADDIENAIRLCTDYHLKGCLLHAAEGFEVAQEIHDAGMPVILGPLRYSDTDRFLANARILAALGVRLAFCSDAPLSDPASLRLSAALAVKYGLKPEAALRALTLTPAELLGVADRVGSLSVGKDADLLLLSGDPLDLTSHIEGVVAGGVLQPGGSVHA